MKLISILIPTYNRGIFLDTTLEVLCPQILKFNDVVELLISDNASIDNTDEVINKYSKIIPINYNKNKENIGFANNTDFLIGRSRGQYIFLMGDDDIVPPNFIQTLMNILLHNRNCSIVHWNRLKGDAECKNGSIVDKDFSDIIWTGPAREFIYRIRENANFISSLLFHRECWELGKSHVKNEYKGYEWFAQIYWGIIQRNQECVYYYFPLVIQRNPSKAWIKYWPQYLAGSLSNIFYDLDVEVPGLYEKWKEKLRIRVPESLYAVGQYREYYKQDEIKKTIFQHLSAKERFLYNFYLIPGAFYIHVIKAKLQQFAKQVL